MSEQFLIDQLDEAIDAIIAGGNVNVFALADQALTDLASLAGELRLLPRESFKTQLKESLRRSKEMTTQGSKAKK